MLMRLLIATGLVIPMAASANCSSYDAASNTMTIRATPAPCQVEEIPKRASAPAQPAEKRESESAEKLRRISNRRYHNEYFAGRITRHYYGQRQ